MKLNEILTEEELDEINRRDFLRHGTLGVMGAALGTAALDQTGPPSAANSEHMARIEQEIADIKARYEAGEIEEVVASSMIQALEKIKQQYS